MKHIPDCIAPLSRALANHCATKDIDGTIWADARDLRRISMTLHRWHELECGDSNSHASTALVRGHKKAGVFEYADDGKPFLETHFHDGSKVRYYPTPDRETDALKRLKAIMARYPSLTPYVQGDPRGAALYILRPEDIRPGQDASTAYTNGIAVYK